MNFVLKNEASQANFFQKIPTKVFNQQRFSHWVYACFEKKAFERLIGPQFYHLKEVITLKQVNPSVAGKKKNLYEQNLHVEANDKKEIACWVRWSSVVKAIVW